MEVSYNKLWKLMIDKGMPNKSDLRKNETVEIVIESDGEYAIYSENESAQNITKNVSIEIERTVDGVSGINKL